MLSEKAAKILLLLIRHENRTMTAGKIAGALGISERSVNTYLKEVYDFCREENIRVSNKTGVGIAVCCPGREEELARLLSGQIGRADSPDSRVRYMVRVLLNNWNSYTTALFAEDLKVSKNTVCQDLKRAEEQLNRMGLEVVKKTGAGIYVRGPEPKLRRAMVRVNRMAGPDEKGAGNQPERDTGDCRMKAETFVRLETCYRGCRVKTCVELIRKMEASWGRKLSDRALEALTEYLIVTSLRAKNGHVIQKGFRAGEGENCEGAAKQAAFLAKALELPKEERAYVQLLLDCMEYQGQVETGAGEPPEVWGDEAKAGENAAGSGGAGIADKPAKTEAELLTDDLIRYVSGVIGLDFTGDTLLRQTLNWYHRSAALRCRYGIELENPFLEDVKKTYPAVFSACFAAGSVIYPRVTGEELSENEVSYLSLLIGGAIVRSEKKISAVVICNGGVGTSQILARKLRDRLPQLMILGIFGSEQVREAARLRPQLVITTVSGIQTPCPSVLISPVLGERDLKLLNRACAEVYTKAETCRNSLAGLLDEDLIVLDYQGRDKDQVLRFMAEGLEQKGYVTEQFLEDVMARESRGSTALGFGVAIPHGVSGYVNRPAVSVVRLEESMDWAGEPVSLIFMLALNFKDIESTRAFFNGFYHLTCEVKIVELLRGVTSPGELIRVISENCV